jgi:hypothetical protein
LNDENLKKGKATQFKAGEEQASIARKGGIASGQARKKKRDAQQAANFVLSLAPSEGNMRNLELLGMTEDDNVSNMEVIMARLALKAIGGDVNAARLLVEISGGTAKDKNERAYIKIEKDKLKLEQQRAEQEFGAEESATTVLTDWVNSVIETDNKNKGDNQ